jgi:hypothetical protein
MIGKSELEEKLVRALLSMIANRNGYRMDAPDFRWVLDRALHIVFWSAIVAMTILHVEQLTPLEKTLSSDFTNLYLIGQLALQGRYLDAYDLQILSDIQTKASGATTFFPWWYSPPVGLLAAFFPMLPLGAAYALFTASTYLIFMLVLRKLSISPETYLVSRLVAAPAIIYNIICGQNGFLIGALIGFFCLFALAGRSRSGVFLGHAGVIKPHLVVSLGALVLIGRRYGCLAVAVATVVIVSFAATLCFGVAVWPAYLKAGAAALELMI